MEAGERHSRHQGFTIDKFNRNEECSRLQYDRFFSHERGNRASLSSQRYESKTISNPPMKTNQTPANGFITRVRSNGFPPAGWFLTLPTEKHRTASAQLKSLHITDDTSNTFHFYGAKKLNNGSRSQYFSLTLYLSPC
jgi:hypothetical protein